MIAIKDYKLLPSTSVPAWVIPDPPGFSACIAHLRELQRGSSSAPKSTASQLKGQCGQQYQALRDQVLSFLISSNELIGEGEARGLRATPAEIKQRYNEVKHSEFPAPGAFRRYLAITGETVADQLFRARLKVFTKKIQAQVLATAGPTQAQRFRAVVKFGEEFPKRWALKTSCRPAYVVPDCKQYRGPLAPRISI